MIKDKSQRCISKIYLREGVNNQVESELEKSLQSIFVDTNVITLRDEIFTAGYEHISESYVDEEDRQQHLKNEFFEKKEYWKDLEETSDKYVLSKGSVQIDTEISNLHSNAEYKIWLTTNPESYLGFRHNIENLYIVHSAYDIIEVIDWLEQLYK